jgi:hypothetical protein
MRRLVVALLLIGAGVLWYGALPPRAATPVTTAPVSALPDAVRGAIHVHSDRSDGTGSVDEIAAAAARAGLKFVIFTDHGDGMRVSSLPDYRQGVLCIDAVEVSTDGGHVIALGASQSPYPLAGESRDVVEDIARLGGFSIAAHPGSNKPELRWRDWSVPIDALEWLNGDSEWRNESWTSLARVLFVYPARPAETVATMLDRPADVLAQWDRLTAQRRVIALAAADAHARLALRGGDDPYGNSPALHVPSYETMFRTFSIVLPGVSLTSDPVQDAEAVVKAIRNGRLYSVIDGIGQPGALSFTAAGTGVGSAVPGDVVGLSERGIPLRVEIPNQPDARIELLRDGVAVATGPGPLLEFTARESGAYRAEVFLPGAPGQPPIPWILSNPIWIGVKIPAQTVTQQRRATSTANVYGDGPAPDWRIENSAESKAVFAVAPAVGGGSQLTMRYGLGGALSSAPYVALVVPAGELLKTHDRLTFVGRADRPTRVSVQLRVPRGTEGERWHRSVYLDNSSRPFTVYFDDMRPRGTTSGERPDLPAVDSVLFVIDTVNTELGASGQIWIDDVRYAR